MRHHHFHNRYQGDQPRQHGLILPVLTALRRQLLTPWLCPQEEHPFFWLWKRRSLFLSKRWAIDLSSSDRMSEPEFAIDLLPNKGHFASTGENK